MKLESERLYLREMTKDDFSSLCKIMQDEEVMYAYEHAFSNEEVENWLKASFKYYSSSGIGLLGVILKETNEMIGQCGLTFQDYKGKSVLEVGYLFQKKFWHKGYATEAAKECIEYAFNKLDAREVYSIIRDNNLPSQRVAIRNGMKKRDSFIKHYYGMDMPHYVYSIKRD